MIIVRNKFDLPQKTSERNAPNDQYKNFVTAHREAAADCIYQPNQEPNVELRWSQ